MRYIAIDIETVGLRLYGGTVWMLSVTDEKGTKVYHDCNGLTKIPASVLKDLADPKVCKVVHNGEFDLPYIEMNMLGAVDYKKKQVDWVKYFGIKIRNVWDTAVCECVIQGVTLDRPNRKLTPHEEAYYAQHSTSLKETLRRYGFPVPNKEIRENFINRPKGKKFTAEEIDYAEGDTKYLLALQKAQEFLLNRDQQLEVALLENKTVERVATQRVLGLGVNEVTWLEIADENLYNYKKAVSKLPKIGNWNSPPQAKQYFRNRGIMIETFEDLERVFLECRDRVLGEFIAVRQMYSDATAYGKRWLYSRNGEFFIDPDGRVRPSWKQVLNTGRFASNNPNILAIPKTGKQRAAIQPRKGYVFVISDFGGQEIGIMAAAAKEDLWIDAMLRGEDVHGLMASVINAASWAQKTLKGCKFPKKCDCPGHKLLREPAKQNNFMLAYGGGADKLLLKIIEAMFEHGIPTKQEVENLMSPLEARIFVKRHKRIIKRLNAYLEHNGREALATGVSFSADPYRRRRVLKGQQDWQIINQGKNNPIQGAGANMLKLAMISMPEEYPIVLPFHDELVCEVPAAKAKKCQKVMKEIMEQSADYITGIKGLIKVEPRIATNFMKG